MLCPVCHAPNQEAGRACVACGQPLSGLRPGSVVAGRYELLQPLGKGGMGVVYRARDRMLREDVALKVLRTDVAGSPTVAERFIQEIRLARRVSHKNVCRIHEYGEDGSLRYISMALVEGTDLKRLLAESGPPAAREAYELSISVAEALQAIHDEGIVHRDLKAPNIMIDAKGAPKLMDFGIAKLWESQAVDLTGTGMIIGTPEYMSPEQIRAERVDCRSDIYSLGIVVYEVFTGHAPFRADTPVALLMKHLQEPAGFEGPEAAAVPRPLVPVLRRALEKDPDARFPSAAEMAEALGQARDATGSPMRECTVTVRGAAVPTVALEPETLPAGTVTEHLPAAVLAPHPPAESGLPTGSPPGRPGAVRLLRAGLAMGVAAAGVGIWLSAVGKAPRPSPAASTMPEAIPTASLPAAAPPPATATEAGLTDQPVEHPQPSPTRVVVAPSVSAPARPAPVPEPMGTLKLVVVPWGDVTVDGAPVQTGPTRRIPLTVGPHQIRVVHPDFHTLQRKITVKVGETVRLTIDLPEEAVRKGD